MRKILIAGNWKMHKSIPETLDFISLLVGKVGEASSLDVVVAPPFTALSAAGKLLGGTPILLAAQNMSQHAEGAFTGEISATMLKDAGCQWVILGHSERRILYSETDVVVCQKVKVALENGLNVIFCLGETESQRGDGATHDVVRSQMQIGLRGLDAGLLASLVIAYEPVWAIGTGKNATPNQAQEVHRFIRSELKNNYGEVFAGSTRIIYGGSVTPENFQSLLQEPDIDGALVGGASLAADSFYDIITLVT